MATITVRDLPDDVRDRLRHRAAEHGRSMEAEVRSILTESVMDVTFSEILLEMATRPRDGRGGWSELEQPPRDLPRPVDVE